MRRLLLIALTLSLAACGKEAPVSDSSNIAGTPAAPTPVASAAMPQAAPASSAESGDAIGYASVAAARAALSERNDVDSREDGGWTIVADQQAGAFWSFAPEDHAAFPAVVKRTIHEAEGKVSITIAMLCEGSQAACDELKRKSDDFNERMRADLQKQADVRKR
jgi:hypothetical protein